MGRRRDLSPRKNGKIELLLSETQMKQTEIAQKMGVSTQIVCAFKKKIDSDTKLGSKRFGRCR